MTKDKADALEIAVAKRLVNFAYQGDYDDLPPELQKNYRKSAAEFIDLVLGAEKRASREGF